MRGRLIYRIFIVILLLVILVGLLMVVYPEYEAQQQEIRMERTAENWRTVYKKSTQSNDDFSELYAAMEKYNREIRENSQSGLIDAWSYQTDVFDLSKYGVEDGTVGVISVPKIDVTLPLYLGASYDNMSKGFAQLSQTSMPIGGTGTNCVVACHRGFQGAAYMRDADKIEKGDMVYLENLWDTLHYEVREIKVIEPHEIDEILIQPGRDLLTIVTCTPYRVGTHRLLIICERIP